MHEEGTPNGTCAHSYERSAARQHDRRQARMGAVAAGDVSDWAVGARTRGDRTLEIRPRSSIGEWTQNNFSMQSAWCNLCCPRRAYPMAVKVAVQSNSRKAAQRKGRQWMSGGKRRITAQPSIPKRRESEQRQHKSKEPHAKAMRCNAK